MNLSNENPSARCGNFPLLCWSFIDFEGPPNNSAAVMWHREFSRLLAERHHQRSHPGLEPACYKTSLADKICPVGTPALPVYGQLADFSFSALGMMHSLCYAPCQSSMAREVMVLVCVGGSSVMIISINGHIFKIPPKYLGLYI